MKKEELKNIQAPIKQKYREEPEKALITLKAQVKIGEGVTCKIETGRALAEAGLHPATGETECRFAPEICCLKLLLHALE